MKNCLVLLGQVLILHGSLIFTQAEEGEKLRGRFQESILLDTPPWGNPNSWTKQAVCSLASKA